MRLMGLQALHGLRALPRVNKVLDLQPQLPKWTQELRPVQPGVSHSQALEVGGSRW